jgi:hypothetical protein
LWQAKESGQPKLAGEGQNPVPFHTLHRLPCGMWHPDECWLTQALKIDPLKNNHISHSGFNFGCYKIGFNFRISFVHTERIPFVHRFRLLQMEEEKNNNTMKFFLVGNPENLRPAIFAKRI